METANLSWLTCCALNSWLLEVNGLNGALDGAIGQLEAADVMLHVPWLLEVDGLNGAWDGAIGQLEAADVMLHVPFVIQWLEPGFNPREYDESGLGPGDDQDGMQRVMPTDNN
jgi:hypothetical protein